MSSYLNEVDKRDHILADETLKCDKGSQRRISGTISKKQQNISSNARSEGL